MVKSIKRNVVMDKNLHSLNRGNKLKVTKKRINVWVIFLDNYFAMFIYSDKLKQKRKLSELYCHSLIRGAH